MAFLGGGPDRPLSAALAVDALASARRAVAAHLARGASIDEWASQRDLDTGGCGRTPPCWPSWEFPGTSTRRHVKHTWTCLLLNAHLRLEIHKSATRPSTMTPWVSFAAGLRRIAGRRRPNFSRSRAGRPRHRRRLRRAKRPSRHVPTRTSQDGARPSASKSGWLARNAPARNEKPPFIEGDVAALSDQDRWPATDVRVSVAAKGPQCQRADANRPSHQQVQSRCRATCCARRSHPRPPLAHQPERRLTRADLARHQPPAQHTLVPQ